MKPKPRFEIPDTLKGGHQTASVPPGAEIPDTLKGGHQTASVPPGVAIPDTLKGGHQTASVPPGVVEMMASLQDWREALMESVEVGGIVECKRDIECIDEIIRSMESHVVYERNRQVILRALWAYDTEASRAAYEAIHFGPRNF